MKRVLCFATGGTISATFDRDAGGLVATVGARDLLGELPDLGAVAAVEGVDLARIGSNSIEPEEAFEWSRVVAAGTVRSNR
jgi:L-asparaginase/Glu-tRNA(Gln) amidotransferase subunit D